MGMHIDVANGQHIKERQPTHHHLGRPPRLEKLDQLEQEVMPSNASSLVHLDRELMRALLRYVRRLERDVAEGGFW